MKTQLWRDLEEGEMPQKGDRCVVDGRWKIPVRPGDWYQDRIWQRPVEDSLSYLQKLGWTVEANTKESPAWIALSDRKPTAEDADKGWVLCAGERNWFATTWDELGSATHWLPIPKLPQPADPDKALFEAWFEKRGRRCFQPTVTEMRLAFRAGLDCARKEAK